VAHPAGAVERAASPPARLAAVEGLRVLGALAVIVIHATPFNRDGRLGLAWNAATVANQLARFAVPAFFVLAGYFWAVRIPDPRGDDRVTRGTVTRLLLLFAAWSLVYVLPYDGALVTADGPRAWLGQLGRNVRWIATHPGTVLLQGTNGHLWFLPALASGVAIAAAVRRWLGWRALVALALLSAAYALLAHPYARTPVGVVVPYNARNGPAFALPCVVIGIALARRRPSARWVAGRGRRWWRWPTREGCGRRGWRRWAPPCWGSTWCTRSWWTCWRHWRGGSPPRGGTWRSCWRCSSCRWGWRGCWRAVRARGARTRWLVTTR